MKKKIILSTLSQFKKFGIKPEYKCEFKLKGLDTTSQDSKRIIKGYACTTHKDRVRDVITLSAIKKAKNDLMQAGANTVFFNHDTDMPIGRVVKTVVDKVGLLTTIVLSQADDVKNIWIKIKEKILNALSIRLRPKKVEVVRDEETGRIEEYRILEMELFEVSVVGLPANAMATINEAVGKSLTRAKKDYNSQRSENMKKDKDKRNQTISEAIEEKMGNTLKKLAKGQKEATEQRKTMAEQMKSLAKVVGTLVKKDDDEDEDEEEEKEKSKKLKKAKKDKGNDKLTAEVAELKKLIKGLTKEDKKRKGSQEDDADDEEEKKKSDKGVPEKILVDAEDPDTLKFVMYAMNHKSVWTGLEDGEQDEVRDLYFQVMVAKMVAGELTDDEG